MILPKKRNAIINLINQTNKTITKENVIKPTQFILITISGGQDSLCLFFILLQLKKQWKWHFGILYCNHFWQIDSFYTNSLVFKLGFFFLVPAYLSLPSENIFSEQKSRTWRYHQFERLNYFYNYDIIVTGHTATDRIETILLQLIRGTSTRGLCTLNWTRDISRHKPKIPKVLPEALIKISFPSYTPIQNDEKIKSFKNNDFLLCSELSSIEFCNQFFLKYQISSLRSSFFCKKKNKNFTLKKRAEQYFLHVVIKSINRVLLQKKSFINNERSSLPSLSFQQKPRCDFRLQSSFIVQTKLGDEQSLSRKSSLRKNSIVLQRNRQNNDYRNNSWIYDSFLFLTLEKKPILNNLYKLNKFDNSYLHSKDISEGCLLGLYKTQIWDPSKRGTFIINSILFSLQNQESLSLEDWKKNRYKNLTINQIIRLNETSPLYFFTGKALLLAKAYWLRISKCITTLSRPRYKSSKTCLILTLQGNRKLKTISICPTVFSGSFIRRAPVITINSVILRKHFVSNKANTSKEKIKFFFYLNLNRRFESNVEPKSKYCAISKQYKWLSFSFNTIILNKQPSKIVIKCFESFYWVKFKKKFEELEIFKSTNLLNFRTNQCLVKPYFILSQYQQTVITTILHKKDWRYIEHLTPILNAHKSKVSVNYKPGFYPIQKNAKHDKRQKFTDWHENTFPERESFTSNQFCDSENYNFMQNKNLAFSQNSQQKVEYNMARWPKARVRIQGQRNNLSETSFLSRGNLNKKNAQKQDHKNTNYSNTLNSLFKTESKVLIDCHKAYIKAKITNFELINPFLLNTNISQTSDYALLSHQQNNNYLIRKINKNVQFVIPVEKGFGWSKINKKKCFIIRPLLFITRFDLKKICSFWELPIYPDQTNEKLIYSRNRIRKQLLPLLRFFFNPQIDKLFLQFTEIANTEQRYLDALSIRLGEEFQMKKINTFELNLLVFNFIPITIQRRLLKNFIDQYLINKVKFFHIQILLKLLTKKKINKSKLCDKLKCNNILINRRKSKIKSLISQSQLNSNKKSYSRETISELILREFFISIQKKGRKTFSFEDTSIIYNQSKLFLEYYYEKTIQSKNESNTYFVKRSRFPNFNISFKSNLELSVIYRIRHEGFSRMDHLYDELCLSFTKKFEKKCFSLEKKNLDRPKITHLTSKMLVRPKFLKPFSIMKQNRSKKSKLRQNLINFNKTVKAHNLFASKNKLETPQIFLFSGVGAYFMASRRFIILSTFLN